MCTWISLAKKSPASILIADKKTKRSEKNSQSFMILIAYQATWISRCKCSQNCVAGVFFALNSVAFFLSRSSSLEKMYVEYNAKKGAFIRYVTLRIHIVSPTDRLWFLGGRFFFLSDDNFLSIACDAFFLTALCWIQPKPVGSTFVFVSLICDMYT